MVTLAPWRWLGDWGQRSWQRVERRLSDPQLYPFLRSNPLTRWVTRRRTARLYDLMSGFANTQVLVACVRLKVFERLAHDALSAKALAQQVQVPESRLVPLLGAAQSLGLIQRRRDGAYELAALALPLLSHPGLQAMVEHNQLLYQDLAEPEVFLRQRGGHMHEFWPYVEGMSERAAPSSQQSQRYSELMDLSQVFVVEEVLAGHRFGQHQCVMDVGCGMGRLMTRVGQQYPQLRLQLFDLPPVVALASERLQQAGLGGRFECHAGSFKTDPLPRGADLITLVRIGHDHSDEVVADLLRKAWEALPVGGQLLLAEPMAIAELDQANASAYFHFYLMAMGDGRLRSPLDYERLLKQAGFDRVKHVRTGMSIHAHVILSTKLGFTPVFNSTSKVRLTHINVR
ncbi:MAG: hypothetical protein EBV20_01645 [Betaproteobacteria bacterium]|nr:hypothetical protein [Betaproteobacteria bacterium]NBP44722.1 hypothetical protein [Betaproteobacteria bacterium]